MKLLWILFIVGQIFSAGNMNHQQDECYYEINPIYGKSPSKERVYYTKGAEILSVYAATKILPRHSKSILKCANIGVYGFIVDDKRKGISMNLRF